LFVCLLATLRKNFRIDLREIVREGWQWADEETDLDSDPDPDRDTGKSALAEVCTVPVLLVCFVL